MALYPKYIGVEVSQTAVDLRRSIFAGDPSNSLFQSNALNPGTATDLPLLFE
jgi:hypothetical protein